ncbi:MAG: hypothetical protein EHM93_12845 [Bacteroidales bacterium]|nr:MAG: hypothetical protein EHM93_12845 [Bacteroidales bacterium]
MQSINNTSELRNAIELLQAEQVFQAELLKEQFYITYESFKPINLLKSSLKDIATSPNLINNVLGAAIGLGTGYLSKKIVVGGSGNLFRKLLGFIIQLGVTSAVNNHPNEIKTFGQYILQLLFKKKGVHSDERN